MAFPVGMGRGGTSQTRLTLLTINELRYRGTGTSPKQANESFPPSSPTQILIKLDPASNKEKWPKY